MNTKVGLIGCGNICNAYFQTNDKFKFFDIVACADIDLDRAKAKAAEWNIAKACTVDELMADDSIDFIISLTIPQAHGPVMMQGLRAGKSVYTEKPFTVERSEAQEIMALAKEKGLRVGSAPDTFLGGAHQTARAVLDSGVIGEVVAATAFMTGHGHETWHPNPDFFYQRGGGPMFDMGPYYLTDLVNLIGPVKRVSAATRITFPERTITSQPLAGNTIKVTTPTHFSGSLEFANGAIATVMMSFDIWAASLPRIEIHGSLGSLFVPDPNGFGGPLTLNLPGKEPEEIPLTRGYLDNARGVGMADMALAMQTGRDHRCNERLAYHVLDLMHAFNDSSEQGRHINIESTCERPALIPAGLADGELDR